MFKLTDEEVQNAFEAIEHHGYSTLIPPPQEWAIIKDNWDAFKIQICSIDLDCYLPYPPMRMYAPKSRYSIRAIILLHPQDLIIYTALTLIVKNDIEEARIPKKSQKVYSFRSKVDIPNQLYQSKNAYQNYQNQLTRKSNYKKVSYVAVTDIADFYPRINQHRLENIITSVATNERSNDVARVLVKKLINHLSDGNSYGIPVGPYASRFLAEAVLIDVDSALIDEGYNFVRWVDDYTFFCKELDECRTALFYIAQWLFDHHGLTLQVKKTKALTKKGFREKLLKKPLERLKKKSQKLIDVWERFKKYEDDEEGQSIELAEEDLEALESVNLKKLLDDALKNKAAIDYEMVGFILGRLASSKQFPNSIKKSILDIVQKNIDHLYPISDGLSHFFIGYKDLTEAQRRKMAKILLAPITSKRKHPPPDYYSMWILNIFATSPEWKNNNELVAIYKKSQSEVVKRYAALSLAQSCTRAQALHTKRDFQNASPMLKLAILLCSTQLGIDEKKHWKRTLALTGFLEKKI